MPLLDAIIIGLMIWALFFRKTTPKKSIDSNKHSGRTTVNSNSSPQTGHKNEQEGKYIDYEEIK